MDHRVKRGAANVWNVTEYSRCLQMSDKKMLHLKKLQSGKQDNF